MNQLSICLLTLLFITQSVLAQEPIIGGPCQGCDYVFIDLPENISSEAHIAPKQSPGEPLTLKGTVFDMDRKPQPGIIIYAYQTDAKGIYPKGSTRHGNLRAWARTDHLGNYTFTTIRPGSYPDRKIPQHIHLHVIEPGKATYYIDDVSFTDDPLNTEQHKAPKACRGGCGLATPQKHADGIWHVRRDIVLGQNISDYPGVSN
ncbi:hypothetical protein [Marinicella sp. W31]|uniref:dioxygenase family protein n=1 Tax=Marinicella sp. W31 TaxID=3023713 RepID=UPI003758408C